MPFTHTGPLRRELAAALPERPFTIEFWDGSRLEPTSPGGPTFTAHSPRAIAHALRAPGQLGIGRAYVAGDLEVSDIDQVMRLLGEWKPPPIDRPTQLRLLGAALAANGLTLLPPHPAPSCGPAAPADRRSGTRGRCATTTTCRPSTSPSSSTSR